MTIIQLLAQSRAEQQRLTTLLAQEQAQENTLLHLYAERHRCYPDGQQVRWRGRPAVARGVTAYYATADQQTLAIAYGVYSPTGEALDSMREDNLEIALPNVDRKL